MCKYKLCQKKESDKTGSHIVPYFLLRRVVSVNGKNRRGYDLPFAINKYGMTLFFGQNVLPDKLEETFGEIADKDIEQNTNTLVVDNFFCSDCEKRLSVIESEYAKTINRKDAKQYKSGVSSLVGVLFWAIHSKTIKYYDTND
jgi:hypothetical protein